MPTTRAATSTRTNTHRARLAVAALAAGAAAATILSACSGTSGAGGSWTAVTPVPSVLAHGSMILAASGHTIYAIDDQVGSVGNPKRNTTELYNTTSGKWTAGAALPDGFDIDSVTTEPNGHLYAAGTTRSDDNGAPQPAAYTLNPATGSWTPSTQPPAPVAPALAAPGSPTVAAAPDGRLFAVTSTVTPAVVHGSRTAKAGHFGTLLAVRNATSEAWTTLASPPKPITVTNAVVGANGHLYVTGSVNNRAYEPAVTFAYNPTSRTWATLTQPDHATDFPQIVAVGDHIWLIGSDDTDDANTTHVYNPATGTWSSGPALPKGLYVNGAVTLGHHIWILGGTTSQAQRLYSLELAS